MLVEEYWYSLLLQLKMMSATSQSHRTDSSMAFFMSPFLRLVNVTWRLRSSAMRWISILRRPTASDGRRQRIGTSQNRQWAGAGLKLAQYRKGQSCGAESRAVARVRPTAEI